MEKTENRNPENELENVSIENKFNFYKLDYDEMVEKLGLATYRFAKRQKTWFNRWEKQGRKINWVKDIDEAEKIIKKTS